LLQLLVRLQLLARQVVMPAVMQQRQPVAMLV
jgi:hypothetical protein